MYKYYSWKRSNKCDTWLGKNSVQPIRVLNTRSRTCTCTDKRTKSEGRRPPTSDPDDRVRTWGAGITGSVVGGRPVRSIGSAVRSVLLLLGNAGDGSTGQLRRKRCRWFFVRVRETFAGGVKLVGRGRSVGGKFFTCHPSAAVIYLSPSTFCVP
jgi:hypothetical protein